MITLGEVIGKVNRSTEHGFIRKFNLFIKVLFAYLALVGLGSFPLFIAQEQTQILTWSNFPAMSEKRYDLVQMNLDSLELTTKFMRNVNKYWMWMCPPQKRSYAIYADGLEGYVATHRAVILGHDPELYEGRVVETLFKYQTRRSLPDYVVLGNNRFSVLADSDFDGGSKYIVAHGVIQVDKINGAFIDMRMK